MKNKVKSTKSSGNVFADLGLPNADQQLIKADIVLAIAERIKTKRLTQAEVSKLIGLAQPDVSKLLRGQFTGYSYERLFAFLTALGDNVKIAVSPAKTRKQARVELELT
jgi:predicted XRE-type DNA-binding protein